MDRNNNFSDKRFRNYVLITGAAGGLGKAFAVECASRGWNLFLTDLNRDALETLTKGLTNTYLVKVLHQACDLTDPAARTKLIRSFAKRSLCFWALINVAGGDFEGLFYEQTGQQIRNIVRLNIEATLDMTHAILALRDPLATFRIINVASLAAFYPMPVKATYAASKRFLLDFSLALREEIRDLGATVTVLCPAGMPTTRACIEAIDRQGLMGQMTTQNIGFVANMTINYALKGKAVCIPGFLNRFLQVAGSLLPVSMLVNLIGSRWKSAHQKRSDKRLEPLNPAASI